MRELIQFRVFSFQKGVFCTLSLSTVPRYVPYMVWITVLYLFLLNWPRLEFVFTFLYPLFSKHCWMTVERLTSQVSCEVKMGFIWLLSIHSNNTEVGSESSKSFKKIVLHFFVLMVRITFRVAFRTRVSFLLETISEVSENISAKWTWGS